MAERLAALGVSGGEAFWLAVRGNLARFADAAGLVACGRRGRSSPSSRMPDFLAEAAALLPPEPWDARHLGRWTERVKQATGRKGKALFMPLRLALTGLDHGPELKALLPLIGPAQAKARLAP